MALLTNTLAFIGALSACISVAAYFSGWADFPSLLREAGARLGITSFAGVRTTFHRTKMILDVGEEGISAVFQTRLADNEDVRATTEVVFQITKSSMKGILGPSNDAGDDQGFQNAQGTLFGFTSQPTTKSGDTYLFFRDKVGQITAITNVNQKVADKLPTPWNDFAKGFLRIESIQRRTVELEVVDFSVPRRGLHFLVEIDVHGNLIYKGGVLNEII